VSARAFDVVLLDMRMPGMTGEEVCRRIREDQRHAALPVIAYTAHSTPEEKERILATGFSGLLVKPTSFADLREACEGLFAAAP
jgi:CheY-like chemotaxis protein